MLKPYYNHLYDTKHSMLWPYLWIGLVTLAYFLCARISHFFVQPNDVTIFWPPSGLLLAFLLLSENRFWKYIIPAVFFTCLAANMILGNILTINIEFVIADCIEGFVGAWILKHLIGTPITLEKFKKVSILAVISVLFTTSIGALFGAGFFALTNDLTVFPKVWSIWWFADTLGILIVAPTFLAWKDIYSVLIKMKFKRYAEMVLLCVCLVIVSIFIFKPSGEGARPLLYIVFPFLIWASLRFGMCGAFTGSLIVVSIAVWHTIHGHGPMAFYGNKVHNVTEYIIWLQAYLGVLMISALIMAAIITRQNRVEEELKLHNEFLKERISVREEEFAYKIKETEFGNSRLQEDFVCSDLREM